MHVFLSFFLILSCHGCKDLGLVLCLIVECNIRQTKTCRITLLLDLSAGRTAYARILTTILLKNFPLQLSQAENKQP